MSKTGKFGLIYGVEDGVSDEIINRQKSNVVNKIIDDLIEDGREFLIHIRCMRTASNKYEDGSSFTADGDLYKLTTFVTLSNPNQTEIGDSVVLPSKKCHDGAGIKWFTMMEYYVDDSEQRWPINVAQINNMWFAESFAFSRGQMAYCRIEEPDMNLLVSQG